MSPANKTAERPTPLAAADDYQLYTVPQVATLLLMSPSRVWQMVADKEIRSFKVGGARRVSAADVRAYLAAAREREETDDR